MIKKILIDDAILGNAFAALDYALSKSSDAKEKLKFFTPMIDIQKATKEFNLKRYSVIEWHGMDEVPSIGEQIFVCYKDGHIGTDVAVGHTTLSVGLIKWHLKHENIENVNLWAHLPKDFKWESLI